MTGSISDAPKDKRKSKGIWLGVRVNKRPETFNINQHDVYFGNGNCLTYDTNIIRPNLQI